MQKEADKIKEKIVRMPHRKDVISKLENEKKKKDSDKDTKKLGCYEKVMKRAWHYFNS